jgi:hypothetical protein
MLEIVQLVVVGVVLAGIGALIIARIRQRWLVPAILLMLFAPAIPMALILLLGTLSSPAPGSGAYNLAFGVMLIGVIILVPWVVIAGICVAIGLVLRRKRPPEPRIPAATRTAPAPPPTSTRPPGGVPAPHFTQTSPDGSIRIEIQPVEWARDQFVHTPRITEIATGRVLCDLLGTDWDANIAYPRDRTIWLGLRRYSAPGHLFADLDLDANRYRIALASVDTPDEEGPLGDISARLEAWWKRAAATARTELTKEGYNVPTPGPFAAWRTALVILIGAIAAIAGLTWYSVAYNVDPPRITHGVPHIPRMR